MPDQIEATEPMEQPAETPQEPIPVEEPAPAPEEQAPPTLDYLGMTLHAGIAPLEVRYAQINNCYRRLPVAYRSFTYVNSVIEGVIPPERYAYAADETDRGERLTRYNVGQAINAIRRFQQAGRNVAFVTARCSPRMVRVDDFYAVVQSLLAEFNFDSPEQLCLEFPRTLFYEDEEQARAALLSMKLLKVKTMITGCGEKDAPITPLMNLPADYVLLAPWLTGLTDNRDRGDAVASLMAFLRSLPCEIVADGVVRDEQITACSRAECFGYIPSSGYHGEVAHGSLRMTLDEAVSQKEEEEL